MTNVSQLRPDDAAGRTPGLPLGRAPYVAMHGFCETPGFATALKRACDDRRLSRVTLDVSPGGVRAATRFFAARPTPDLLILETQAEGAALLEDLGKLAEVCDVTTRVILVGRSNDIALYRQLIDSGIAEYLVAPVDPLAIIGVVLAVLQREGAARVGKVLAFLGANGGVGSSTVAQNVAWALAETGQKVLLADLDLHFGTAALNFDIDSPTSFAERIGDVGQLDDALLERLLHRRGANLGLLTGATAPGLLAEPKVEALDRLLDLATAAFPLVVLDLPHAWTPWTQRALLAADEVVLTATPDLASLRNLQGLLDRLREMRPNDLKPRLVLNQAGVPRRAEIQPRAFAAAIGAELEATIPFDPAVFSKAASKGRMIAEIAQRSAPCRELDRLARTLTGAARPAAPAGRRRFWQR